jgi:hypothetical protein
MRHIDFEIRNPGALGYPWCSFPEYCEYCRARLRADDSWPVITSNFWIAYACEQCLAEHTIEQRALAARKLNNYLETYRLQILPDMADYSDDDNQSPYKDICYLTDGSDLFTNASDVIRLAAHILTPILVGVAGTQY